MNERHTFGDIHIEKFTWAGRTTWTAKELDYDATDRDPERRLPTRVSARRYSGRKKLLMDLAFGKHRWGEWR